MGHILTCQSAVVVVAFLVAFDRSLSLLCLCARCKIPLLHLKVLNCAATRLRANLSSGNYHFSTCGLVACGTLVDLWEWTYEILASSTTGAIPRSSPHKYDSGQQRIRCKNSEIAWVGTSLSARSNTIEPL
eukprot:scaffold18651_cov73-Cylindrotheca_fusiformis.AAC.2